MKWPDRQEQIKQDFAYLKAFLEDFKHKNGEV